MTNMIYVNIHFLRINWVALSSLVRLLFVPHSWHPPPPPYSRMGTRWSSDIVSQSKINQGNDEFRPLQCHVGSPLQYLKPRSLTKLRGAVHFPTAYWPTTVVQIFAEKFPRRRFLAKVQQRWKARDQPGFESFHRSGQLSVTRAESRSHCSLESRYSLSSIPSATNIFINSNKSFCKSDKYILAHSCQSRGHCKLSSR